MNLNQHCLYHGLLYSSGIHLNCFTILAMVGIHDVHVGITDYEKKPNTEKGSRRADHYHMYCQGRFGPCTKFMKHLERLLAPIILDTPTDWDTVNTWPKLLPGTIVRSVPLLEALNATVVHAQTSDVNASASSTFVAPPVSVDESLVRGPVSAAGEDLKLGRSVFVGLVLRRCSYLAVTWQFTALQFYMVSRSFGAHLSHSGPCKDPFQIASGAHLWLILYALKTSQQPSQLKANSLDFLKDTTSIAVFASLGF